MEDTTTLFYQEKLSSIQNDLAALKKRIYTVGTLRLTVVLLTIGGVYLSWSSELTFPLIILLAGIILFLALYVHHDKLFRRRDYLEAMASICRKEIQLKHLDFTGIPDGREYLSGDHDYLNDLDLFGPKSFYAYINRSTSEIGNKRLVEMLKHPLTDVEAIVSRQEAIAELASLTDLRFDLLATGMTGKETTDDETRLLNFINGGAVMKGKILKNVIMILPAIYIALLICVLAGWLPASIILILLLCVLLFSFSKAKTVISKGSLVNKQLQSLRNYACLIRLIENKKFSSSLLSGITSDLHNDGCNVSSKIERLSKLLNRLELTLNIFGYVILNGFLLWDMRQLFAIEAWRKQNIKDLPKWLDTLAEIDALCTWGTFGYNHPDYVFPRPVATDSPVLSARAMGHPLIPRNACVKNPVELASRPAFLVVTGANMAGKSTYLRTIGINLLLAQSGAPVNAEEMIFTPCTLFTSLRTSDSLSENESYFFAELKRLKQMVDRLKSGEKMFVILDEILKGTNSVDKQKGSLALIEQLIDLKASGVIATHDLLLGELAKKHPEQIDNFRFEAEIKNDELTFSYKIQSGIAQNMNAFFLMKKMGIIVDRFIPENKSF